jgi:hypothetical protein
MMTSMKVALVCAGLTVITIVILLWYQNLLWPVLTQEEQDQLAHRIKTEEKAADLKRNCMRLSYMRMSDMTPADLKQWQTCSMIGY